MAPNNLVRTGHSVLIDLERRGTPLLMSTNSLVLRRTKIFAPLLVKTLNFI